jgi:hypothetical protein
MSAFVNNNFSTASLGKTLKENLIMAKYENAQAALVAVLVEADKLGANLDKLKDASHAGLMGGALYAPPGASEKPSAVQALTDALEEAKKLIAIAGASK